MAQRKLSTKKYVLALILTIIIFLGGIVAGVMLEDARLKDTKQITLSEKVNLRSLQLQKEYIDLGIAECNALNHILEANINELAKKIAIIIDYEKTSVFSEEEFDLELRDYFLTEIQFLFVSNEIDNKCGNDNVKVIYFYDENADDTQGKVLDYLKKLFGSKVLVFSFDSNFQQEPMINILLTSYNIQQFPSVIVGDTVFQGNTPVRELMESICNEFRAIGKEIPKECNVIQ
ncbi:hypothetical protein HOL21_00470 [Candidatus Woesearchaeota archaeon]|jgi:hypothetical protein|nr:hypothetical protein [Candidatus Woesearchaeota archaeon]MBT5396671.1 hypothetical protein [Candidatus Woesearchaeota archaeon]MBT5924384.1 hypothetical protein [Candidatus Woesearchaeota archaeon]MBT6367542.1 hypothetical protein [Candidatus Woesearchaeota archaeon]MBT7763041.1 hypothetical protein [Candidatus Woesearchaeota archaeon]